MRYKALFVGVYFECLLIKEKNFIYEKKCCNEKYVWPSEKYCATCGKILKKNKTGVYESKAQKAINFCKEMEDAYGVHNVDYDINDNLEHDYWCVRGSFFEDCGRESFFKKEFPISDFGETPEEVDIIKQFDSFYGKINIKHGFLRFLRHR